MVTDLPDYSKKVIVIYEGTITGGEVLVDHRKILGIALKTPTFAQCIPTSIENDAIAYEPVNDRFKVNIEAMTVGTIDVDVIDKAARLLGHVTVDDIADISKTATSKYLAPTALGIGGTATIWTPAAGKAIRAKRIQVSVDAATRIDFRWTTTAFESYYLPINGSVVVNLIGSNEQPAANATLTILSSAAANVTAKASGDEV